MALEPPRQSGRIAELSLRYTFVHKRAESLASVWALGQWREDVSELPLILVIEDEYGLHGLIEDALKDGGFEPHILSSGEEALTLFKGKVADYKALVTDVNLKGAMSGWEVARQIREAAAAFPVVYMTGASGDQWTSQGVPNSILLQKPFAPAQLVTAVSQLLNAPPA
jgi:DNA-binding response OmpR family regulator